MTHESFPVFSKGNRTTVSPKEALKEQRTTEAVCKALLSKLGPWNEPTQPLQQMYGNIDPKLREFDTLCTAKAFIDPQQKTYRLDPDIGAVLHADVCLYRKNLGTFYAYYIGIEWELTTCTSNYEMLLTGMGTKTDLCHYIKCVLEDMQDLQAQIRAHILYNGSLQRAVKHRIDTPDTFYYISLTGLCQRRLPSAPTQNDAQEQYLANLGLLRQFYRTASAICQYYHNYYSTFSQQLCLLQNRLKHHRLLFKKSIETRELPNAPRES